MEYVEGVNLATHATEGRMLPPRLVCEMCARVADALYFAHQRGVIHRDIKPANIVFDQKNRRVRVMDFGVARLENSRATRTGRDSRHRPRTWRPSSSMRGRSRRNPTCFRWASPCSSC